MRTVHFAQVIGCLREKKNYGVSCFAQVMQWGIAARRCFHVASFEKGERDSHFALWQAFNLDTTGIRCPRFGNIIIIFPDLVKYSTRLAPAHTFRGKFDWISTINEDRNDGCCLVHGINTADRSSLQDRWVTEYHLGYKYKDNPYRRVTLAISESYRASCRVFLVQR